jgi:hypothetical protein
MLCLIFRFEKGEIPTERFLYYGDFFNRMKELPKKYLSTKNRQEMWKDTSKIIKKIDKELDLKEIHVVGSLISKKKNINDIDFAIITKVKNKESNSAYPVDLIILPDNEDTEEYLKFFEKYMKKKYGSSFGPVKIK